jgi:hypothetical protein
VALIFSKQEKESEFARAEKMVAAYNDALERVLGAPAGSVNMIDGKTLRAWFV